MSQITQPDSAGAIIAPASASEKEDFRENVMEAPDDPNAVLDLFSNPPEFNEALLRAKESRKRLFRKAN
ncbi:MAG: hypothetical protein J0I20_20655 [Chloroflexi bacterium]|nr:hypothetical protein [Chloroflexota bacterium]OJV96623.1 MAG: hypothetical protein BGO39_10245 [Chloroflexi bacterium 54-19]